MFTERLEIRPATENDRARFVEMFTDDAFMAFSAGTHDAQSANDRFDRMLERSKEFAFAKQPVIEQASGEIVGYSGVDKAQFEGELRVEFGYRLVERARGRGYATEAGRALIEIANKTWTGELIAIIDPRNRPSANVAQKLGFTHWKRGLVYGVIDDVYRLSIPAVQRSGAYGLNRSGGDS